ncbi:MAG TPA: nicotinate (nicotinamide) nucleotide adenylyltransferase [Cytophagaceae bacterium]|jgi:nicotinate-nucleotide adenylyltransferase|nr:nicotinate (nicotinamide) nucleotide adenylyltransferase [Cytophagaceae bacterium]
MKIGLFFGSFNPIHIGHLIIANTMAENTDLQEVWLVVSPQNPLKKNSGLLHEFDRYEMVSLAIQDSYKLKVSDVEFQLPRPSYTIDTLTHLSATYPQHQFVLIIGEDNLCSFPKWKNNDKILEYYELYVYPRPKTESTELANHPKIKFIPAPLLDISATYIRSTIKEGKSIRYLVTDPVENLIKRKKFYL